MDQMPSPVEVLLIGKAALDGLTATRQTRVLASVSRAVYLRTGDGQIYWVTSPQSPSHRRGVQISSPLPFDQTGEIVDVGGWRLDSQSLDSLHPGHPGIWREPALPTGKIPIESLPGQVMDFYERFLPSHHPIGLGCLVPHILGWMRAQDLAAMPISQAASPVAAWSTIDRVLTALVRHDVHALHEASEALIGFGEGLTPSGDDFLGGLFFCLHILQRTYPKSLHCQWNYPGFIERNDGRTNPISLTLLKDLASGHAISPMPLFAAGLFAGQSYEYLSTRAEEIVRVGHSSGWDLLTGFLAGMGAILPRAGISCSN